VHGQGERAEGRGMAQQVRRQGSWAGGAGRVWGTQANGAGKAANSDKYNAPGYLKASQQQQWSRGSQRLG